MSDHSLQAPSPEYLGELLPQYEIEALIAQGGMGAVYKARQISLDRHVAIKVLLYEFGEDAEFRESFTTEAKAMARLNHPNLIGVFDYGTVEGMPYIVMEYVAGQSLHEAAWQQAIQPSQAVAIVLGICDGLAHAHRHEIVHRDIKPSNILLTPEVKPKIADFGLARAVDSDKSGPVMGTPGYTAPEVFEDPAQAGKLADVYAVGVILHQLLTGIDPAGSMGPPTQVTGDPRLDSIYRKATHIIPLQRYQSVEALASDLKKWSAAKQKAPIASHVAPAYPRRPVQTHTGGNMIKACGIGALVTVPLIIFLLYQKNQRELKARIPDAPPAAVASDSTPIPDNPPESRVPPRLPDKNEPASKPDEPGDVGMHQEPDIPPVPDSGPEAKPTLDPDLQPADPELRERAIGLILEARKKRDSGFVENARALLRQLDGRASRGVKSQGRLVERLKAEVVDNRIPLTDGTRDLPKEIAKDFDYALGKDKALDESHRRDLTRIRDAYVGRLEGAAAKTSDEELKQRLLAQAERAKDLDAWIGALAPEPKVFVRKTIGGVVGHWDEQVNTKTTRWIAHPDGTMEIDGEKAPVVWEIREDGVLVVTWSNKAFYTFIRDGDGWIGTTSFKDKVTLTRGDW